MIGHLVGELATGHSWSGGGGAISLTPAAGAILTFVLVRSILELPIGIPTVAASAVLGTPFWIAADTWGSTVTITVWVLCALLIRAVLRGARGSP